MSETSIDLQDGLNESVFLNRHWTFEILLANAMPLLSDLLGPVSLSSVPSALP